MADFTGFNPNDITHSIKNMNSGYSELCSIYNSKLKKFVEDVSTCWACPEAITFFNTEFKPMTTNLGRNIESQFSLINELMNNAAQAWARTTSSSFTNVAFQNGLIKEVDVTIIKDNINGFVCEVKSVSSLQATLEKAIDLPKDDYKRLATNAYEIVKRDFDSKVFLEKYVENRIELYNKSKK